MKINGNTVGTTMPRANYNQTDPKKADYLVGRENIVGKEECHQIADNTTAIGKNSVAGCLGYYYSAVDIPKKHIYLSTEQVVPIINASDLGLTDGSFDTYCSSAFDGYGLWGLTVVSLSEAKDDGYIDVESIQIDTANVGSGDYSRTLNFSIPSDFDKLTEKTGVSLVGGYAHVPRNPNGNTVLGYKLPWNCITGKVTFKLRVRTNTKNIRINLCGNGYSSKMIFGTNGDGNLFLKQSHVCMLANNFADEEWHDVNIVVDMDARTVSAFADQKQIDVSGFHDESFEAPQYAIGDTFSVVNGSHYDYVATISAIDGNRITYDGDIGFKSISGDEGHDAYAFTVPENPLVGVIPFGEGAFASGEGAIASNRSSTSLGRNTRALGDYAAAIGRDVIALYCALGLGKDIASRAMYGIVGGASSANLKEAIASITYGLGLLNHTANSAVFGKYNDDTESHLFALGNGKSDTERSNAHTVDFDGNAWYLGDVFVGDKKKLATEQYATELFSQLLKRIEALESK